MTTKPKELFTKNRVLFFWFFLIVALPKLVLAAPVRVEHVEAELVSEVKSVKPGAPFWVAIRLRMDDDWHTYWRNPGDSGLETQATWNLPKGFEAGEIEWPRPERLIVADLVTYGYQGEVFLLTKITPPMSMSAGDESVLSANVIWLSCSEVCIPGQAQLDLKLPQSDDLPKLDERWAHDFAKTRDRLPTQKAGWQVSAQKKGKKIVMSVSANQQEIPDHFTFYPYEEGMFNLIAQQKFSKTKNGFKLEIPVSKSYSKQISEVKGLLVGRQSQTVEIKAMVRK